MRSASSPAAPATLHIAAAISWCGLTDVGRRFLGLAGFRPELLQEFARENLPGALSTLSLIESRDVASADDLHRSLSELTARAQIADHLVCVSSARPPIASMLAWAGTEGVAVAIGLSGATITALDGDALREVIDHLDAVPDGVVVAEPHDVPVGSQ